MNDPKYLEKIYLLRVRRITRNEWLRLAEGDKPLFEFLANLLGEKQMGYENFMEFHFKSNRYLRPKYICSPEAIRRYEVHQKLKSSYYSDSYSIDNNRVYINSTYKSYPLEQLKSSTAKDIDANFALVMSDKQIPTFDKGVWEACEYTIVKFEYLFKTPPTNLINLLQNQRRKKEEHDKTKTNRV